MLMVSTASQTLHHYRGSPQTGSPNKRVSGCGATSTKIGKAELRMSAKR